MFAWQALVPNGFSFYTSYLKKIVLKTSKVNEQRHPQTPQREMSQGVCAQPGFQPERTNCSGKNGGELEPESTHTNDTILTQLHTQITHFFWSLNLIKKHMKLHAWAFW